MKIIIKNLPACRCFGAWNIYKKSLTWSPKKPEYYFPGSRYRIDALEFTIERHQKKTIRVRFRSSGEFMPLDTLDIDIPYEKNEIGYVITFNNEYSVEKISKNPFVSMNEKST